MIKRPTFNFDKDLFKRSVEYNVRTMYRRTMKEATDQQVFQASAMALKDQIIDCWMRTQKVFDEKDPKQVVTCPWSSSWAELSEMTPST